MFSHPNWSSVSTLKFPHSTPSLHQPDSSLKALDAPSQMNTGLQSEPQTLSSSQSHTEIAYAFTLNAHKVNQQTVFAFTLKKASSSSKHHWSLLGSTSQTYHSHKTLTHEPRLKRPSFSSWPVQFHWFRRSSASVNQSKSRSLEYSSSLLVVFPSVKTNSRLFTRQEPNWTPFMRATPRTPSHTHLSRL